MNLQNIIGATILTVGMIFASCTKEKGPKGDTGAAGPAGTANIENKTVTVHTSDWAKDSVNGQFYFNYPCSSNSNSAVIGYMQASAGKECLPYHDNATNMRYEFATDLDLSPSYIQIQVTDLTSVNVAPPSDKTFYFVIIPPALKKPGVNYNNYAEVKAAHNL
ncbi:MAG: hypothetical protein ACXVC6_04595 [Bacteroidia bacterium]